MQVQLPFLLLSSASAYLAGFGIAWWLRARHAAADLDRLEQDMIEQVTERYNAYLVLEQQVRDLIGGFARAEQEHASELDQRHRELCELRATLDRLRGVQVERPAEQPGFLQRLAGSFAAVPRGGSLEAQLVGWQRRLEVVEAERQAERERQTQAIAELSAELQRLDRELPPRAGPPAEPVEQAELERLRARCAQLERDVAAAAARAAAHVCSAAPEPSAPGADAGLGALLRRVRALEAESAESHARAAGVARARDAAVATLEERVRAAEGWRDRCEHTESQLRELRVRHEAALTVVVDLSTRQSEMSQSLTLARAEADRLLEELQKTQTRLQALVGEIQSAEDEVGRLQGSLDERLNALESERSGRERAEARLSDSTEAVRTLNHQLESAQRDVEVLRAGAAERERDLKDQIVVLESQLGRAERQVAESGELKQRVAELQQALAARERRIISLDAQVNEVQSALKAQASEVEKLRGELHRARTLADSAKAAVSEQTRQFETAANLLNKLRPMVEALESELSTKPEPHP